MKQEQRLEKFYYLKTLSEELGQVVAEDVLQQITTLEEQVINDEVLPAIKANVEPLLAKVKKEIAFNVVYRPDIGIAIHRTTMPVLPDVEEEPQDEPSAEPMKRKQVHNRVKVNPTSILRVTMFNGEVIEEPRAIATFTKVIERLGIANVRKLGLTANTIPLVSNAKDLYRPQKQVGGYYISSNSSTKAKKNILEQIAKEMHLNITVEIVER